MNSHQIRVAIQQLLRRFGRISVVMALLITLGACTSQAAREAEIAAIEAERVAQEQEAAQLAQEQARQQAMQEQRRREVAAAERARIAAEQQRREEEALARAEEERRRQEEIEQRERDRLAAIAAAEAERQEKLDRISQLEMQIASITSDTGQDESTTAILQEAILVAEELLDTLTSEQAKYENTDDQGNTLEPLAKELINELEARKNNLVRQSQGL
jgi:IgA-specific serine endopeptidase